jgi:CRP-like cAMP-binding protein
VDIIIDENYRTSLNEWDIFGEIALLNEEQRTATVQAKTNLEVIILTQEHLFELINNGNYSINADIMNRIEENLKIN